MIVSKDIELRLKEHLHGALFSIETPRPSFRGKVRDMFHSADTIIMVNTDRISAFDHVLGTIPLKGAMLCEQSQFWFDFSKDIVDNHVIDRPDPQIMVVKKAEPILVEVIVRGYLAGSLMREPASRRGQAYGLVLDPTLKNYGQFEEPIITPTTKAQSGEHDLPISADAIIKKNLASKIQWQEISTIARKLFFAASIKAREQGLLLVDTKYEFGLIGGKIHLIDEVHTSDSSRFFIASDYEEKFKTKDAPIMLDKEYLRQNLLQRGFDPFSGDITTLTLDDELRMEVAKRYLVLTEKITGQSFKFPEDFAHRRVHQHLAKLIC
jgi:phosphoribosylaminoimidazole-succinocarboxamide synthase